MSWRTLWRRFGSLGLTGFGGPAAHVARMRAQWVTSGDLTEDDFSHAFAAASLLPGPASTQTALWVGWRQRGLRGMLLAGALFITPSVVLVITLMSVLQGHSAAQPLVQSLALGAALAVPGVAMWSGGRPLFELRQRTDIPTSDFMVRLTLAALAGALVFVAPGFSPTLSIVLAGLITWALHQRPSAFALGTTSLGATTGLLGLAFKVGALSFGGGFVIVAMMRHDAVTTHHWMSSDLFAQAVALGQLTPGPVVATIGAVGYAVGGTKLAVAAAVIAFLPSFLFVGLGAPFFERVRTSVHALAFFRGASAAALGLIVTSGVVLTQGFHSWWEWCSVATLVVMGSRLSPLWLLGCGTLVGLAHLAVTAG